MSLPPLVSASRPAQSAAPLQGWPFLRLGFRPFYLGTALLACLAVPLWIAIFLGRIQVPLPMSPLLWHAHEMLFGFAAGVVVGFLLTAVKAWTGLETAAVRCWARWPCCGWPRGWLRWWRPTPSMPRWTCCCCRPWPPCCCAC